MNISEFDKRADEWDNVPRRQILAKNTFKALTNKINLSEDMSVADFGTGTGLILIQIQPFVKKITGFDNSQGMLQVLNQKLAEHNFANTETVLFDADTEEFPTEKFDLFVSSMAFHHVKDTQSIVDKSYASLKPGGKFFIADLVKEDGSFHGQREDVFHLGYDLNEFKEKMEIAGFKNAECKVIFEIEKENKKFPVFGAYGEK